MRAESEKPLVSVEAAGGALTNRNAADDALRVCRLRYVTAGAESCSHR